MINGRHSVSGCLLLEGLAAAIIMDLTTASLYTSGKRTRVTWFQFSLGGIFWNAAIGTVVGGQCRGYWVINLVEEDS